MDTDAFHGVKKCAEVIFKDGKMVKGERLTVLEKHINALGANKKKRSSYQVLSKLINDDVGMVIKRVKEEVQ